MKDRDHCTSGVCPETSKKGEIVQLYVDYDHPLLQLNRVLPWELKQGMVVIHVELDDFARRCRDTGAYIERVAKWT